MSFTLPTLVQLFLLAYVLWSFLEVLMKCRHPLGALPFYLLFAWYVVIFYAVIDYQVYNWTILYRGIHWVNAAGLLLFLVSSFLRFSAVRTLKRQDDTDEPVNSGLFALVRYPLLSTYLLQLTGIILCFGSGGGVIGLFAVCIPLIILWIRSFERMIPYDQEEQVRIYRSKVPYWLLPRIW